MCTAQPFYLFFKQANDVISNTYLLELFDNSPKTLVPTTPKHSENLHDQPRVVAQTFNV